MLYMFCSAAAPLYKRDALECISYPGGHILRFRYAHKYVHKRVLDNLAAYVDKQALLVFVDTVGAPRANDFNFYPLRLVTITRIEESAGAIYLDFACGEFVNYVTGDQRQAAWDCFFRNHRSRPWPPGARSGPQADGYFVLEDEILPPDFTSESEKPHENWNSVVIQLDKTKDLADSTFCLVLGFFYSRRRRFLDVHKSEERLEPVRDGYESIYPVPMGRSVVLKMLLSRPSFNYADASAVRTLSISTAGDVFSGMSKGKIFSESRYNEDRTVFVCKRVFDTVLAIVSIEEGGSQDVRSPRLTLLTRVQVPRLIIGTVVAGVALGALLLAMDAEVIRFIASCVSAQKAGWFINNAKSIAAIGKLLSPLPVAMSAYLAFRRLPIR